MTFRIQRPDRFRVEWRQSGAPVSYTVSDGTTLVRSDGGQSRSQPMSRAEWPFPMMGLLNNMPGPVSAVPATLDGRRALLAVDASPAGRSEFWFDPKTHLLIRWTTYITWKGKTSKAMRTDFSGWALNRPIPPSVFRLPVAGAGHG